MNSRVALLCILSFLAGAVVSREIPRAKGKPPALSAAVKAPAPAPAASLPRAQSQSGTFEERLAAAPGTDWSNTAERWRRAAILIEWLGADRSAALHFLASNRFTDIFLPGLAEAIGRTASAAELLAVANSAENPGSAISMIGKWAGPEAVNGLADLMPSVNADAAPQTAGAVAGLLAGINLDRGLAFAMAQPDARVRADAIGGVFDELRGGPNGETAIRALYARMPPDIQSSDPVRFSYGNVIWGSDPVAALQTLEGIASPQARTMGLLVLARNTASSSPETAIAAIYASGLTPQGIYNHVGPILQNWSAVDPQAAASFLSTTQIIPSGDLPRYAPIAPQAPGGKG